jgi:hypothetical protein
VRLWDHAPLDQEQRLQAVFFPEGVTFDGEQIRTAATCLAFTQLPEFNGAEEGLASPTESDSNRLLAWLRECDDLRRAFVAAA